MCYNVGIGIAKSMRIGIFTIWKETKPNQSQTIANVLVINFYSVLKSIWDTSFTFQHCKLKANWCTSILRLLVPHFASFVHNRDCFLFPNADWNRFDFMLLVPRVFKSHIVLILYKIWYQWSHINVNFCPPDVCVLHYKWHIYINSIYFIPMTFM